MRWRLTSELMAYFISGTNRVYLASVDKKQDMTKVIKLIDPSITYQELRLYENQFNIRFRSNDINNLILEARSNEFPSSDSWYIVENYYSENIWELLESHTIVNGDFDESINFEVGFADEIPEVIFVEPKMKNFKVYFEEMRRRINCELCKKTSKRIPGHRYDTLTESFYFLAPVKGRLENIRNSEYKMGSDKPDVFLYVNSIEDSEKTVSDVLRNRAFGDGPDDIKVFYGKKTLVDAGSALDDDFTGNIRDYWESLYSNTSERSLKDILGIFSVITGEDELNLSDSLRNHIIEKTKDCLVNNIILENWNLQSLRDDLIIKDSNSLETNISNLKRLFFTKGFIDCNFLKNIYYSKLYEELKIDLSGVLKVALDIWGTMTLDSDFETYIKYQSYFANPGRFKPLQDSRQRVTSTKYKLDVITLKDIFGDCELRDVIIETINHVRDNFGLGASLYNLVNIGTKAEPMEYIICNITLNDIIRYKGLSGLSEDLKRDIAKRHFVSITVSFDKDGKIS